MSPLAEEFQELDFEGHSQHTARRLAANGIVGNGANSLYNNHHHHPHRVQMPQQQQQQHGLHHQHQRSAAHGLQHQRHQSAGREGANYNHQQQQQEVINIKEEMADLDLDSLHGLISTCDFTADLDIKPPVVSPPSPPEIVTCHMTNASMHRQSSHPQLSPVSPVSGYFGGKAAAAQVPPVPSAQQPSLSPGHYGGVGNSFDAFGSPSVMRRPSAIGFAPSRQPPHALVSPLKRSHSSLLNGGEHHEKNGFNAAPATAAAVDSPNEGCGGGLLVPAAAAVMARPAAVTVALGEEEMLSLMKLEMSFENSNSSLPCMSPETAAIWNAVLSSYNFELLKNGFHFDWISEAIEVSLRRNLIFMQVRLN
jgi:hypothetical protein